MRVYMPPNLSDNGGVFGGLIKKRNAIEAGIFIGILLFVLKLISGFIGPLFTILLGIVIGFPASAVLLIGINGRTVFDIIFCRIHYERTKCIATLRKPEIKRSRK